MLQRSLFWRIYAVILGSLLLTAIAAALVWHLTTPAPSHRRPAAHDRVAQVLPPASAPAAEAQSAVEKLAQEMNAQIILLDADGRPAAGAAPAGAAPPHPGCANRRCLRRGRIFLERRVRLADGRSLLIETPMRMAPNAPHLLALLLVIAGVVAAVAYPLVSRLTVRLERLGGDVDAWGAGDLGRRAVVDGSDEVAGVARRFNAAADRIEALLAAHRDLLAHASHELRTPLTRLRVAAEMLAAAPDPQRLAEVVAEVGEIDALVEEILLASRLDHAGADAEAIEPVDLLALVAEEAARAGATLLPTDATAGSFEVRGTPRLLRRMIRNLFDNASRHGAPPVLASVDHVTSAEGDTLVLRVRDHGQGIAADERERVFDPFHRPAGRSESAGGWGLGLSLVRQIARRHGGEVRCEAGDDGGASFVVRLPART